MKDTKRSYIIQTIFFGIVILLIFLNSKFNSEPKETRNGEYDVKYFHKFQKIRNLSGEGVVIGILAVDFIQYEMVGRNCINPKSVVPGHNLDEVKDKNGGRTINLIKEFAPKASFVPVKISADKSSKVYLNEGVYHAINNGASIIVNTIGSLEQSDSLTAIIDYIESQNAIFITSEPEYEIKNSRATDLPPSKLDRRIIHATVLPSARLAKVPDTSYDFYCWPYKLQTRHNNLKTVSPTNSGAVVAATIALMLESMPGRSSDQIRKRLRASTFVYEGYKALDSYKAVYNRLPLDSKVRTETSTEMHKALKN